MMKNKDRNTGKNTLRLVVVMLFLLLLGVGSWASSNLFSQQGSTVRWHPRRPPANAEFVGDQVCAQCHKKIVEPQAHSAMGLAMEPVADSKLLIENPYMTFRSGPYTFEIN